MTPDETARYLVALSILKARVAELESELKDAHLASVPPGVSWPVTIPSDNPNKPTPVGSVIRPKGTVVARISDRPAWEAWVRENAPTEVLVRQAPRLVTQMTEEMESAIRDGAAVSRDDPWADPAPAYVVDALAAAGYAIVPSKQGEDREEVSTAFEQATLMQAENDAACDLPGISVDTVPGGSLTVRSDAKRNDALALAFFRTFKPGELDDLASGQLAIAPAEED